MLSLEQKEERHKRRKRWTNALQDAAKQDTLTMTAHLIADLEEKAEKWDAIRELIEEIVDAAIRGHEDSGHYFDR